jgi:hypothetical protein
MAQQPLVGQDLHMIEAARSHSDTPHSARLLWTSDQAEGSDIYIPSCNSQNRRTATHPMGFEPAIAGSQRS